MTDERTGEDRRTETVVRAAARNSGVGAAGALASSALGFLLAVVVGRALGADSSGVFFACVAIATVLTTVACAGADSGLMWALARDRAAHGGRDGHAILRVGLLPVAGAALVLAVALWLAADELAEWIAHGADVDDATAMLRVMSGALLVGPLVQCLVQGSRGLGDIVPFALVQQVGLPALRVLAAVVLLAAAPSERGVWATAAWALPLVLLLPVAALVVRRRSARTLPPPGERGHGRDVASTFWRYSLWRGVGTSASMMLVWLDVVLVAALASPAAAGAYAAASRFATSGQLGLQAVRLGIGPAVAAAFARGETAQVGVLYGVSTRWSVLLSWPIYLNLVLFAGPVLRWFGPGFDRAATALVVLSAAMMLSVAAGSVGTLLLMSGRSGWATRNTVLALAVTVSIDLAAIPAWGAVGASIGWMAGVVVENGLGLVLVSRRLGIRPDRAALAGTAATALALSLAVGVPARLLLGDTTAAFVVSSAVTGAAVLAHVYLARHSLHLHTLLDGRRRGAGGRGRVDAT